MKKKIYFTKTPSSDQWFLFDKTKTEFKGSRIYYDQNSLIVFNKKWGNGILWVINTYIEINLIKDVNYLISFELLQKTSIKLSSIKIAFIDYWDINRIDISQDIELTEIEEKNYINIKSKFSKKIYFALMFNWGKKIDQNALCQIQNFTLESELLDYKKINYFNDILYKYKKGNEQIHDLIRDGNYNKIMNSYDWIFSNDWNEQVWGSSISNDNNNGIILNHRKWGKEYLWIINKNIKFHFIYGVKYFISFNIIKDTNSNIEKIISGQIVDFYENNIVLAESIAYNYNKSKIEIFFKSKVTGDFYIGFEIFFKDKVGYQLKCKINDFQIKMLKFHFSNIKFLYINFLSKFKFNKPILTKSQLKKNPYYCISPFIYLVIRPWGDYTYCCRVQSLTSIPQNNNLDEIMNSTELNFIRQNILNHHYIIDCSKCYDEEKLGKLSLRQKFNKDFGNTTKAELKFLEIAFSNKCNLSCLTCASYNSSKWIKEDKLIGRTVYNTINNDLEYKKINYNKLTKIKFLGGEPFIEKKIFEFLEYLDNINVLKKIHLIFSTNCTVFPDLKKLKLLEKAKKFILTLSIDGIGSVNDYIRYGSKWNEIEKNINKWYSCGLDNIEYIEIETVISIYNLFYSEEIDSFVGNRKHYAEILTIPEFLSITILPEEIKRKLDNMKIIGNMGKTIKNFIHSQKPDNELFNKFIDYTFKLDKIRNQKFSEMCPKSYNNIFTDKKT